MSLFERIERYWPVISFAGAAILLMAVKSMSFLSAGVYALLVVGGVAVGDGLVYLVGDIAGFFRGVKSYKVVVRSDQKGDTKNEG